MDIKVTKVEFDGADYEVLLNQIKELEVGKEEALRAATHIGSVLHKFITKLSEVADLRGLDIRQDDYDLFIEAGVASDRVKISTRKK